MEKYIDHFQAFFSRAKNYYKNVKEHKVGAFSRLVSKSFRTLKSIAFQCKFPMFNQAIWKIEIFNLLQKPELITHQMFN